MEAAEANERKAVERMKTAEVATAAKVRRVVAPKVCVRSVVFACARECAQASERKRAMPSHVASYRTGVAPAPARMCMLIITHTFLACESAACALADQRRRLVVPPTAPCYIFI